MDTQSQPQWFDVGGDLNAPDIGTGIPPSSLLPRVERCLSESDKAEMEAFKNGTWKPPQKSGANASPESAATSPRTSPKDAPDCPPASPTPKRSKWTEDEVANLKTEILERMAKGEPLRAICEDARMPCFSTVWSRWRRDDRAFSQAFKESQEQQAEFLADQCIEIADSVGSFVQAQIAKLQIDTRMRRAAQLKPAVFAPKGDTTNVNVGVAVGLTMNEERRQELIAKRRAYLDGVEIEEAQPALPPTSD